MSQKELMMLDEDLRACYFEQDVDDDWTFADIFKPGMSEYEAEFAALRALGKI